MKNLVEIKMILQGYKEELRKKYGIKEIGIFGSYVREEQKEISDVDILVEFEKTPDLLKFIEIERYLEELIDVKVDLVRKKILRDELKPYILKEVIVL